MDVLFTAHAEFRIQQRRILKQEIMDSINYPDNIAKRHGLHYFQKRLERGIIEICCEKTETNIKIITAYWL